MEQQLERQRDQSEEHHRRRVAAGGAGATAKNNNRDDFFYKGPPAGWKDGRQCLAWRFLAAVSSSFDSSSCVMLLSFARTFINRAREREQKSKRRRV